MVMVHHRDGTFNIAVQELDTGTLRLLTETHLDVSPSVAPNGAMLIYSTRYRGRGELAVVSLDAGTRDYLPSERGEGREPAWSQFFDEGIFENPSVQRWRQSRFLKHQDAHI